MSEETRDVRPGAAPGSVTDERGKLLTVPDGWGLLPPGDAAATRRVKQAGPHWVMSRPKGRRTIGMGIWAPQATIDSVVAALKTEREDPAYTRKLEAGRARRAKQQHEYVGDFREAVAAFLAFDARYLELQAAVAQAIATHATPVGSGTVARTQRIPIERRAEAATIAWLRHQTTGYDSMYIPREKGRRREVRRMLAEHSRQLLQAYRHGVSVDPESCPLRRALPNEAAAEAGEQSGT